MSTILVIDTASSRMAVALAVDGELAELRSEEGGHDHSRLLLALIESVTGGRQLSGIAVVRGPGSYAGLRVGIATAQGLALSLDVPLRGMSTLGAAAAAGQEQLCTVIHPAGRGEYAAQPFASGAPAGPIRVARAEELRGLQLVGEGAGELGGREVGPEERCRAALHAFEPDIAPAGGEVVDALYLREPNITVSRRPVSQQPRSA